jgi:cytoskeletal protein CcmA (bactofilin family)
MAERVSQLDPERLEPVLASGAEFCGLLVLHGTARIDGSVRGEVMGADLLWIGPGASVEACLAAREIVVAGEVKGDLVAEGRIELRPGARVLGDVETARLSMAEGSVLEGACRAGAAPAGTPEAPSSP